MVRNSPRLFLSGFVTLLLSVLILIPSLEAAELMKARAITAGLSVSIVIRTGSAKGFFKQEGLDLEISHASHGLLNIAAVQSGSADFGQAAYTQVIAAVSKGVPLVVIALHNYGYTGKVLVSKKNQGIKSMADLKGKSVAVQVGTGIYNVWARYLNHLGLSRDDFKITNIQTTMIPSAFEAGSVDAALVWEPYASSMVEKGLGRVLLTEKDIADPIGVTYPFLVFTTKKMIEEKPEIVQRFLNGWARTMRFVDTQREETIGIMTEAFVQQGQSVDRDSTREIIYRMYFDRAKLRETDIQDILSMAKFLKEEGNIKRIPKPEEFINTVFAEKAEKVVK